MKGNPYTFLLVIYLGMQAFKRGRAIRPPVDEGTLLFIWFIPFLAAFVFAFNQTQMHALKRVFDGLCVALYLSWFRYVMKSRIRNRDLAVLVALHAAFGFYATIAASNLDAALSQSADTWAEVVEAHSGDEVQVGGAHISDAQVRDEAQIRDE
jgi:hypothetical protein